MTRAAEGGHRSGEARADTPLVAAWSTLCHHCDGIAIGTTLETLDRHGAFGRMVRGTFSPETLAAACRLRPGFTALAVKLLRSQGFVERRAGGCALTRDGLALARRAPRFSGARARILDAARLLAALADDGADFAEGVAPVSEIPGGDELDARLRQQALGPCAAAAWFGLERRGALARLARGGRHPQDGAEAAALGILRQVGWVRQAPGGSFGLTREGTAAVGLAAQYAYPLAYLPTSAAVPSLLVEGTITAPASGAETHLDRALDIAFSGEVFARHCRGPFLETVLPLFDDPDIAGQPRAIVDTGSGDGTMLAMLHEAVAAESLRGMLLAPFPLVLVGVEINAVAREATAARLAALGAPFLALSGDIARPDLIMGRLAAEGIEPDHVLHVNKSVIHNRTHRRPDRSLRSPDTEAVCVADGGATIPADEAFGALVALFEAWKPFLTRHGMVSIEAHTVSPERAARHVGRSLITGLDASHGYSCQYLAEIGVHRAAADAAGLRRLSSRDLGADMMGEPLTSIDHLKAG